MKHGLSSYFGAIAAWLCLAPIVFAPEPPSVSSALAAGSAPHHNIVFLLYFLIWITGGIFFAVGGLLAFVPFKRQTRKSGPLPEPSQFYASSGIDLAWTVIPVLILVAFLTTPPIRFAVQNLSKPGAAVEITAIVADVCQ